EAALIRLCQDVCFISVFVFKCYGAPADLHSFPTRRSSDLTQDGPVRQPRRRDRAAAVQGRGRGRRGAAAPEHRPDLRGRRAGRADRKSTRLNSSHVSISYAVFCLKKKKTSE